MVMKDKISKVISDVLEEMGHADIGFEVEHPKIEEHGDYASNVALVLAKREGMNPGNLAAEILGILKEKGKIEEIERMEVAGAGFINFWLKEEYLVSELMRAVEDEKFGESKWGKGKKMLVDYSSPNIAKDFSVGHLRSTIIGEAIRRLYEACGWETIGDNHLGDWGTQFGMIVAAVEEGGKDLKEMSVAEMEKMYVEYNKRAKEDESLREKAKMAFVRLEKGDKGAREIWQKAKEASMAEFKKIYDMLGVKIEHAYGESAYEEEMKSVLEDVEKAGLMEESEGAKIIRLEDMTPGMLVKSDGGTTYLTRDLATIRFRNREFGADRYVYEVGAEQSLHFKQVFAAAEKLGYGKASEWVHVAHGLILGEDGKKMSTRKGTGVKMEEWLDRAVAAAGKINKTSARQVGIGAVKFFDLKHTPETSYRFVWKEVLSLDGDSGPYLQYTYARCRSMLEQAGKVEAIAKVGLNEEEIVVLRWLYQMEEVVDRAAMEYAPNRLAEWLIELARRFNGLYNKHRFLEAESEEKRILRLTIAKGVSLVLADGLKILGIEVVEKM